MTQKCRYSVLHNASGRDLGRGEVYVMIRNRKDLAKVKRIVVKVGTSTITYPNCSRNFTRMDHLCRELADLHNQGLEVILVTSGWD